MTRRILVPFATTLFLLAGVAILPAQQTFRATVDGVVVEASVRDRRGRVLSELQASDFEITDNGVKQTVVDMTFGTLPIDVTVGLDVSTSVTGAVLEQLRAAVLKLMEDLRPQDRLKLVVFNQRVARVVDFTGDAAGVERAVKTVVASGGTSFFDAISVALISASDADRRQFVVFFTDGSDTSSTTEPGILLEIARRTRATLTVLKPAGVAPAGLSTSATSTRLLYDSQSRFLASLTTETGGELMMPDMRRGLEASFRQALETFRSTYVLRFILKGVERKGYHALGVTVRNPEAIVVARQGYVGG